MSFYAFYIIFYLDNLYEQPSTYKTVSVVFVLIYSLALAFSQKKRKKKLLTYDVGVLMMCCVFCRQISEDLIIF